LAAAAFCGERLLFRAQLQPLNTKLSKRYSFGTATVEVRGDSLVFDLAAADLHPGIRHIQGCYAKTGRKAPPPLTDKNRDGVVDRGELEVAAGEAFIPFHASLPCLGFEDITYSTASAEGLLLYAKTISFPALRRAFTHTYQADTLRLEGMAVCIYGIDPAISVPVTVHPSAPGMIPVAHGILKRVSAARPRF